MIKSILFICIFLNNFQLNEAEYVSKEAIGRRSLRSYHGTFIRNSMSETSNVDLTQNRKACAQWTISEQSVKVALEPLCSTGKYIRANMDGSVNLSDKMESQDSWMPLNVGLQNDTLKWTPAKNEDGSWSFQSDYGGYLSADKNGSVYTIKGGIGAWEHFWLESWTGFERAPSGQASGQRCIKSVFHNTLLRGWGKERRVDFGTRPKDQEERWIIEDHDGKVLFKSYQPDRYLCARPDGAVDLAVSFQMTDVLWIPYKNDDGSWSFLSDYGGFLRADANGTAYITKDLADDSENFWLPTWTGRLPDDEFYFHHRPPTWTTSSTEVSNTLALSLAEEGGEMRTIQTTNGGFFRCIMLEADSAGVNLSLTESPCGLWNISEQKGKVSLRCVCSDKYLRVSISGSVDTAPWSDSSLWTPRNNHDGSWSFMDDVRSFLSADNYGSLKVVNNNNDTSTHFWIRSSKTLNSRALAGMRYIKTNLGHFLRTSESQYGVYVDSSKMDYSLHLSKCALWHVTEDNALISLEPECLRGKFLRIRGDRIEISEERQMWLSFENSYGSRSLLMRNRGLLNANDTGSLHISNDDLASEGHFRFELWTGLVPDNYDGAAEIAGLHYIESSNNMSLRGCAMHRHYSDWERLNALHFKELDRWQIENREGKVAMKAYCAGKFLSANTSYRDLPARLEMWTPIRNGDGWSFQSYFGDWIAQGPLGRVSLKERSEENAPDVFSVLSVSSSCKYPFIALIVIIIYVAFLLCCAISRHRKSRYTRRLNAPLPEIDPSTTRIAHPKESVYAMIVENNTTEVANCGYAHITQDSVPSITEKEESDNCNVNSYS